MTGFEASGSRFNLTPRDDDDDNVEEEGGRGDGERTAVG